MDTLGNDTSVKKREITGKEMQFSENTCQLMYFSIGSQNFFGDPHVSDPQDQEVSAFLQEVS